MSDFDNPAYTLVECEDGYIEAFVGHRGRVLVLSPNGQWAETMNSEDPDIDPLEPEELARLEISESVWNDVRVAVSIAIVESRRRR